MWSKWLMSIAPLESLCWDNALSSISSSSSNCSSQLTPAPTEQPRDCTVRSVEVGEHWCWGEPRSQEDRTTRIIELQALSESMACMLGPLIGCIIRCESTRLMSDIRRRLLNAECADWAVFYKSGTDSTVLSSFLKLSYARRYTAHFSHTSASPQESEWQETLIT